MTPSPESRLIRTYLRKNPKYEEFKTPDQPRYFLAVDFPLLRGEGKGATIPLYWRLNPRSDIIHKEVYSCAVLGNAIERGSLPSLIEAVRKGLLGALREGSWPLYFLTGASRQPVPVYSGGSKLSATIGAVNLQGSNIVELWQRASELLLDTRQISSLDSVSILTVGTDLNVLPPAALLFCPGPPLLRLPLLLESEKAPSVFTYFEGQKVSESGSDDNLLESIFALWQEISGQLGERRKISDPAELQIAQLEPYIWESHKALAASRYSLTFSAAAQGPRPVKTTLEVYQREGRLLTALPASRGSFTLFVASDARQLAERVGAELVRQGSLETPEQVTFETIRRD